MAPLSVEKQRSDINQCGGGIERILWLDSIKGILIFLVVFGHLIAGESAYNLDIYGYTHYLIYCIHMPMFMFISGFFSKKKIGWKKLVSGYILPYLIFDLFYAFLTLVLGNGEIADLNFLIPVYVYWFILCLAVMRGFASSKINNEIILAISIGFTLITPLIPSNVWSVLSLGRVFLLWPIFYIGLKSGCGILTWFRSRKWLSIVICFIAIAVELILLLSGCVTVRWATHNYPQSYQELFLKYVFMVCTLGCFLGFAAVVPEKLKWLNRWGRNSVLVYLLHPFFITLIKWVIKKADIIWDARMFVICVIIVFCIVNFLSLNIWKTLYDRILHRLTMLLRLSE